MFCLILISWKLVSGTKKGNSDSFLAIVRNKPETENLKKKNCEIKKSKLQKETVIIASLHLTILTYFLRTVHSKNAGLF